MKLTWMARGVRPASPGWYWFDPGEPFRSRGEVFMVCVRVMPDGYVDIWSDNASRLPQYVRSDQIADQRFAGPIPEPEDD